MKSIQIKDFDLKHTLECGQFFRFKKIDDWYFVNSRDKLFKLKQDRDKLYYKFANSGDEKFLRGFFRLDEDLNEIVKEISKDKHVKKAVAKYKGLRLIKQDPWECAISYLCSSAANIPKIQMNVELLSKYFGKPVELEGYKSFTFPEPGKINDLKKIKASKIGFRSEFVLLANDKLQDIHRLKSLKYEEAKNELMKNKGIGEKIADCICLFSLDKNEAFPVDTWVKKVMKELYGVEKDASSFGRKYFGKNAGYAQQYLFYMVRDK